MFGLLDLLKEIFTRLVGDDSGERRRVLVVLGVVTGVAATAALFYTLWPQPASIRIDQPEDGATVAAEFVAHGTSEHLGSDEVIRLAVYVVEARRYYPAAEAATVATEGRWTIPAAVGVPDGSATLFEIVALLVDEAGEEALASYFAAGEEAQDWPGLLELPDGVAIHDRVAVIAEPLRAPPASDDVETSTPAPETDADAGETAAGVTPEGSPEQPVDVGPRLALPAIVEAEDGHGDGSIEDRSSASGGRTVLLAAGEQRLFSVPVPEPGLYPLVVRYSNDSGGPLEAIAVSIDGVTISEFDAQDTGDGGHGWNRFATSPVIEVALAGGVHTLALLVEGGDGFGVEMDGVATNWSTPPGPLPGDGSWTVVLASLEIGEHSRASADERAEELADQTGVVTGVLLSNQYASLNPGYWVVYGGGFLGRQEAVMLQEDLVPVAADCYVRKLSTSPTTTTTTTTTTFTSSTSSTTTSSTTTTSTSSSTTTSTTSTTSTTTTTLPDHAPLPAEAEDGTGDGRSMARTEASGGTTVLLHEGEVRHMVFVVSEARSTSIQVRYSNDSDGPPDLVTLALDGAPIGQFEAEDTGDYGHGWNKFVWSSSMPAELTTGTHELTVTVTSGDYYGIEIDVVAEG